MPVPVVQVGIVGVGVRQARVLVTMAVRLGTVPRLIVGVQMVRVMSVPMAVRERFVRVLVHMVLADV